MQTQSDSISTRSLHLPKIQTVGLQTCTESSQDARLLFVKWITKEILIDFLFFFCLKSLPKH